ncbi:MAG: ATP-binding cassette domain-containing protein [Verrucomicrobiae bacterium]|nr:ATP-binding cassette domain-containing protein [Verrucomicrobiae bacterium]NNJ42451.1 ATP-binding cassette domain-containing protein [Akkermansiaceae bacterium]
MSLQLTHISHSFGATEALHDISLEIRTGEQVALIGPSGCGKTTLLRLMGTQLAPSSGSITQLDQTPAELGPRELKKLRTRIAMIPQHLGLVPNVRVLRNVLNGGMGEMTLLQTVRQMIYPKPKETQRAYNLLGRTGIRGKIYDRTDSLSGGQQQRVAVARALYQDPTILLADEPVSSIDPARARDTIQLLTQLSKEEGITLIVSLHHLELAQEFFPRLIGLRDGRMAFDSAPDALSEEECRKLYQLDHSSHG